MKALEVKTLTKRYGSARGVEDLSFGIEKGAIFGKSGWPIGDMCVLLSLLAVSTVLGGVIWSRRDLPL